MPIIRFIADPKLPRDWAHKPYHGGTEHDVSSDEANRWVRRGVAVIVGEPIQGLSAEVPALPDPVGPAVLGVTEAPDIPDDWQSQHHTARIALARQLTEDPVNTAADADRIIAAEIERRAQA